MSNCVDCDKKLKIGDTFTNGDKNEQGDMNYRCKECAIAFYEQKAGVLAYATLSDMPAILSKNVT